MLNIIWLVLTAGSVLLAGFNHRLKDVGEGAIRGSETAVTLAIGLIGVMTLWLGIMRLAEKAGFVQALARWLRPLLRWLFPDVPADHPAMGSMVMNIAANMLGLNNAATPLGLRAMKDLESLNPVPGTATNAMCTFLAINTSSVQLIPITAIALLAANKSANPTAIIGTSIMASLCSAIVGVTVVKWLEKFYPKPGSIEGTPISSPVQAATTEIPPALIPLNKSKWLLLSLFLLCFVVFLVRGDSDAGTQWSFARIVNSISLLAIPFLLSFIPVYAALRGIPIYEEFIEGAKEGFQTGIRIIPYLVAMLVGISMFRAAGAIDWITRMLRPVLDSVGFPTELLPMALMRPLSGSGSLAILSDLIKQFGPDHLLSRTAATLYGSTETTFYVVAVYFGSVGIRRTRHAIPAGLMADVAGIVVSVIICRRIFG